MTVTSGLLDSSRPSGTLGSRVSWNVAVPSATENDLVAEEHTARGCKRTQGRVARRVMAAEILRLLVRCDRFAPGAVREALAQLPGLGWVLGDVMLVGSELMTNAVKYSLCTEYE